MDKLTIKIIGLYSAILGLAFGMNALMQIIAGSGMVGEMPNVSADILGGIAGAVISLTFLKGVPQLLNGKIDGLSYVFVGSLLCFALSGVYISTFATSWIDDNIISGFEPGFNGKIQDKVNNGQGEFRVEIFYLFLVLPGFIAIRYDRRCETC